MTNEEKIALYPIFQNKGNTIVAKKTTNDRISLILWYGDDYDLHKDDTTEQKQARLLVVLT